MRGIALFLALSVALCGPARAETLARHVETMRDYDLAELDGAAPARPLRFYIGANSAFAICGKCLCGTGIMTGRYPRLGIRPTSASPTLSCKQGTRAFDADAAMVSRFFKMTRAQVSGDLVTFSMGDTQRMVFRLGGAKLSPP